jgi:hypothetical protein
LGGVVGVLINVIPGLDLLLDHIVENIASTTLDTALDNMRTSLGSLPMGAVFCFPDAVGTLSIFGPRFSAPGSLTARAERAKGARSTPAPDSRRRRRRPSSGALRLVEGWDDSARSMSGYPLTPGS